MYTDIDTVKASMGGNSGSFQHLEELLWKAGARPPLYAFVLPFEEQVSLGPRTADMKACCIATITILGVRGPSERWVCVRKKLVQGLLVA